MSPSVILTLVIVAVLWLSALLLVVGLCWAAKQPSSHQPDSVRRDDAGNNEPTALSSTAEQSLSRAA
jgi:hypothetical protein